MYDTAYWLTNTVVPPAHAQRVYVIVSIHDHRSAYRPIDPDRPLPLPPSPRRGPQPRRPRSPHRRESHRLELATTLGGKKLLRQSLMVLKYLALAVHTSMHGRM